MDNFADTFGGPPEPPVEDFDGDGNNLEADPAAEFLAREQEELAGLEDDDDIKPVVTNGLSSEFETSRRSPSPVFNEAPQRERPPREEPEKIKRWREEQQGRLQKKDEDEEKKKAEMKEAARKELDEWYKTHDEQVVKTRNANRSAEKELVADTEPMAPGTEWERIAKLCDFNPKASKHTKDISRMRSIILQVKQAPPMKPLN
ncbi:clathrin light chain isoform X2 [Folsomia candida]|uniref:Clathrin light chain n=1 Tax=Folsomia candida TaxID=158441 RepID=A0A226ENA0_FOLCA|nr:clathrin light chain isoform X2 [Folsomia candida]OXA59133.1 Clathrin light chain A [Folsomia candida]